MDPPAPTSGDAICYSLEPLARDHAAALASEGGDRVIDTGRPLIGGLAAACNWST